MATITADHAPPGITAKTGIWGRQLARYPKTGPRALYLLIVILTTVIQYYELYVGGSVATKISNELNMTLTFLIVVAIVGAGLGVFSALFAGLADRWGRANLIVYGLAITGALVYAVSFVHTKVAYLVLVGIIGLVEGVILVTTPALIRDFSPQLGRASAMGFWTLGPVMGSLVVTEISSHTLDAHPDWQFQFRICGIVGIVVFVIAFFGLRELAPQLRDQLMVSMRDRTLIEAKARGIDPEAALKGHWRQMLRADIIGPSFGIGVFLLFYYIAVGLFTVFFVTNYGYSLSKANDLGNWYWGIQAVALIVTGLLSDWLKVRKPFMVIGGLISAAGVLMFGLQTTKTDTSYNQWIPWILMISIGGAIAFAAWFAAFTETVEKHNPAGTATGLAVQASVLRVVVVASLIGLIFAVPAASTLVDQGQKVQIAAAGQDPKLTADQNATVKAVAADPTIATRAQSLATQYQAQLATAKLMKPATQAALVANPTDPAAQAEALSEISGIALADVTKVIALSTKYKDQLATLAVIDPGTQTALVLTPNDPATQTTALNEIQNALHVSAADAAAKLAAVGAIPAADLVFLGSNGPAVQRAATALTALGAVPPADLAFLAKYGPGLQDPAVVAQLTYLQNNAPIVLKAAKDSPIQWQRWWWVCLGGQILFLPFIFLLTGRWSPRKAREDAKAHAEAVNRELATLMAQESPSTASA
jgi:ACS family D-galactonate transporter-like MFS transporter